MDTFAWENNKNKGEYTAHLGYKAMFVTDLQEPIWW
jgi:hypothetical protein